MSKFAHLSKHQYECYTSLQFGQRRMLETAAKREPHLAEEYLASMPLPESVTDSPEEAYQAEQCRMIVRPLGLNAAKALLEVKAEADPRVRLHGPSDVLGLYFHSDDYGTMPVLALATEYADETCHLVKGYHVCNPTKAERGTFFAVVGKTTRELKMSRITLNCTQQISCGPMTNRITKLLTWGGIDTEDELRSPVPIERVDARTGKVRGPWTGNDALDTRTAELTDAIKANLAAHQDTELVDAVDSRIDESMDLEAEVKELNTARRTKGRKAK